MNFITVTVLVTIFSFACVSAGVLERDETRTDEKDVVRSSGSSSLAIDVNMYDDLLKYSVAAATASGLSVSDVWKNILNYLKLRDILGLWLYLSAIPEMKDVLTWLEKNHPDVFVAVCWIFDACGTHDIPIDPKVIQKIMQLIAKNDWDGLVTYLNTLEHFDALCDWIRTNFPEAWSNICIKVGRPC